MEPVLFDEQPPDAVATLQAQSEILLAECNFFQHLFLNAPGLMCVLRGPEHIFELANTAWLDLMGSREIIGMPIREALPEIRGQGHVKLLDTVFESATPFIGCGMRLVLSRPDDSAAVERYFDFTFQPILNPEARVTGIFVSGIDVTDRILAQEQQRLLMDELNHRVKNMLATVRAIATNTLRTNPSPEHFVVAFQSRLMALVRTHNALTHGQWQGADLGSLLRAELEPYGKPQILLDGDTIRLTPRAALSLGMVFHELAINAAKYGALSARDGRLEIRWHREAGTDSQTAARLTVEWLEAGGPVPLPTPKRRGFGSRLIERSIVKELHGTYCLDYRPTGLVCQLSLPQQVIL